MITEQDDDSTELIDASAIAAITQGEIGSQIAAAKANKRTLSRFMKECEQLVTLDEDVASQCMYSLERTDKNGKKVAIQGPSARFAEILAYSWGNCRAGARIVAEDDQFVTAQGVYHDLEKNTAIAYEVRRRITTSTGRKFGADMIAVTANAASSIALRNAVTKGIPKALWWPLYQKAVRTAIGDASTLNERRAAMLSYFQKMQVNEAMILKKLGVESVQEIDLDKLAILKGFATAIKDNEQTVDGVFADEPPPSTKTADLNAKLEEAKKARHEPTTPQPSAEDLEKTKALLAESPDTTVDETGQASLGLERTESPEEAAQRKLEAARAARNIGARK